MTSVVDAAKMARPRTITQAVVLLDEVARLDGEARSIETNRNAAIADTNAVADALLTKVIERRAQLAAVLERWWHTSGRALLVGKRKTIELGGCVIGTKTAPTALAYGAKNDFKMAVASLQEQRWGKPFVRVSYDVDKKAVAAALADKRGQALRDMGFESRGGGEEFVLEAVKQAGTVG